MAHTTIPSPQELQAAQEAVNGPQIDAAVAQIVAEMKKAGAGRIVAYVSVPYHLQAIVRGRFASAGWELKFRDDQRDGASVEVIPL